MPRQKRCEFQGAINLVTLRGFSGGNVFYDPQILQRHPEKPRSHAADAGYFEDLLWNTCDQYYALVHAYVLEPNAALIIIQTLGAPLRWVMHDLLARYSVYLREQKRIPEGPKPFPGRYKAQIIQPAKLPYVVRYIQRREVAGDHRRRAINHPFSSSLIHCGRRSKPACFVVNATREALERLGHCGPNSYFEFMAAGDSPSIAHMLSGQIIGERHFAESVRKLGLKPPKVPCRDEILREVTGILLHTVPGIACSSTHRGALARALVAWYAMRTGAAQIGEVGRWFGVTSSDLRYLIRRHRPRHPEYFSKPVADLFPALSGLEEAAPLPEQYELTDPGSRQEPRPDPNLPIGV